MSILFRGNLEEGNYTLIKSTDGWVLKGETSYVGFNFADRPQGEWKPKNHHTDYCSNCGFEETQWRTAEYNYCPNCGSYNGGEEE